MDRLKEFEQEKGGVDVTTFITYKTPSVVNSHLVIVSLSLENLFTFNTIFLWPFIQTIKVSILTDKNALVSGIILEQLNLEMIYHKDTGKHPSHNNS